MLRPIFKNEITILDKLRVKTAHSNSVIKGNAEKKIIIFYPKRMNLKNKLPIPFL